MQETIDLNDGVLESLRTTMEKDSTKIVALGSEVRKLNAEGSQKDLLIEKVLKEAEEDCVLMDEVIKEISEKSEQIYQEYKKALAIFGAELADLPQDYEGGASGLLNWILKEFTVLGDILTMTSDNSAVVSCKSILALLDREGCQDLQKIGSHDFFSEYSELESNIA